MREGWGICFPCGTGAHTLCSGKHEDRWQDRRECVVCHPPTVPDRWVIEVFYALTVALFYARGTVDEGVREEVFHAVRFQMADAPIEQWTLCLKITDAIWTEGKKDHYSRNETAEALEATGLDVEWARTTKARAKRVVV